MNDQSSMKKYISKRLSSVPSSQKNDALTCLMLLGLKHYSDCLMNRTDRGFDVSVLRELAVKHMKELVAKPVQATRRNQHACIPKAQFEKQPTTNARKGRSDLMTHFPFTDEVGTVGSILMEKPRTAVQTEQTEFPIVNMGKPARVRLVSKVFDEMRFHQKGIKMSDLPDALDRLGIPISPELKRILVKTKNNPDTSYTPYDAKSHTFYQEPVIIFDQWRSIVRYYVDGIREGVDPRQIVSLRLCDDVPGETGNIRDSGDDYDPKANANIGLMNTQQRRERVKTPNVGYADDFIDSEGDEDGSDCLLYTSDAADDGPPV
jgi:hypothetical protein